MAQSKLEKLRAATAKPRPELTDKNREDLGRKLLSPQSPIRRVLFTLYVDDIDWLRQTAERLKRSRRKTAKSELMRLGISLMKEKSEEELLSRLRTLE